MHRFLFSLVDDLSYLSKSHYPIFLKIKIFSIYINLLTKFRLRSLFGIHSDSINENIFNFKLVAFNFMTLSYLFKEIFLRDEYYFKSEKNNPIIIDCGANIGIASVYFKYIYPNAEIHAFEPDPATFNLLKYNCNLLNIRSYNSAISNILGGQIEFFLVKNSPGSLRMSTKSSRRDGEKIMVNAISLSEFIANKEIDFLKMDIEGAELEVFMELFKTNKIKQIKEMVIEYHHKISGESSNLAKFLSILEQSGFEYQINTRCCPISAKDKYQDVIIHAYL